MDRRCNLGGDTAERLVLINENGSVCFANGIQDGILVQRTDGTEIEDFSIDVMLGGELTDIMRVRRYLDAERGGW